jgi:hypothetical protein
MGMKTTGSDPENRRKVIFGGGVRGRGMPGIFSHKKGHREKQSEVVYQHHYILSDACCFDD